TVLFAWEGCRERRFPPIGGAFLGAAAALVFTASYARGLVEWVQDRAVPPDRQAVAALREEALALRGEDGVLVVDAVSARLAFDLNLPPGTKDWSWLFLWAHPPVGPAPQHPPTRFVYLLSPQACLYRPYYSSFPQPRDIRLFGHRIAHTAANRNELFLIPPGSVPATVPGN
ncbi:MAG TPA: hypothetical protein VIM58_05810, partial [Candidatus Methylacidiphilales bacterium]